MHTPVPQQAEVPEPDSVGPCPVCGQSAQHLLDARDRNRATTGESFPYDRCRSCRTVFIRRIPADLGRYYEAGYYQFDADGEPSWRHEPRRLAISNYRLGLLRPYVSSGHLIEIGAGTGAFSIPARDAGFRVSAVEMNERCCDYLEAQPGIEALLSDDPLASLAALDQAAAIALWHVLEHLEDPVAVLERSVEALEPGGVLALAIPNPDSLQFRLLKARWMQLDAPRHLRLLPPDTVAQIGERTGLREVERTSTDPDAREFDLVGWINAFARPPALHGGSRLTAQLGGLLWRLASPIEKRPGQSSAVTLLLQRQ